jgi:hypothetical protein
MLYYWVMLMRSDFNLLPGIYYVLQTRFPMFLAYYDTFAPMPGQHLSPGQFFLILNQFSEGIHLVVAITIAVSILIPFACYLYWRKMSKGSCTRQKIIYSNAAFAMIYLMLLYSIFQIAFFIFSPPFPSLRYHESYYYVGYLHFPLSIGYFISLIYGPFMSNINLAGRLVSDLEYLIAVFAVLLIIAVLIHFITERRLLT